MARLLIQTLTQVGQYEYEMRGPLRSRQEDEFYVAPVLRAVCDYDPYTKFARWMARVIIQICIGIH